MEPDHSAGIAEFSAAYPDAVIVGNDKTFTMINNFYGGDFIKNSLFVKNGDTLSLGEHELNFVFAPMVHWPEVMMTYDTKDKVFFSADAFGKFGALDADEDWRAKREDTISASSENTADPCRRCSRKPPGSISRSYARSTDLFSARISDII